MSVWIEFCKRNEIGDEFHEVNPSVLDDGLKDLGNDWCRSPFSMLLWGKAGTGKTHFSLCLVRYFLEKKPHMGLTWKRSKMIDDDLHDCYRQEGSYRSYLRYLKDCEILMIDDFGVEKDSDPSMRNYYDIINHRWEHHKPTVISTNYEGSDLFKHYGERISSRLKDYESIQFLYTDHRGKGNYRKKEFMA